MEKIGSEEDLPKEVESQEDQSSNISRSGTADAGAGQSFLRHTVKRMMISAIVNTDAVLETIKRFEEAHEESRNYLRTHTSHFVGYVGSGSGSTNARDM